MTCIFPDSLDVVTCAHKEREREREREITHWSFFYLLLKEQLECHPMCMKLNCLNSFHHWQSTLFQGNREPPAKWKKIQYKNVTRWSEAAVNQNQHAGRHVSHLLTWNNCLFSTWPTRFFFFFYKWTWPTRFMLKRIIFLLVITHAQPTTLPFTLLL